MVIGACGFTGSGSSAITDYLKEFDSFTVYDDLEFILTHSPDGLEDLDYQLNNHCSKYTSSEVAIKRFRRNVSNYIINRIDSKDQKKKIESLTEEFISEITQVKWYGFGSADLQLLSSKYQMIKFEIGKHLLQYLPQNIKQNYSWYPAHVMEFSICPDDFYVFAKRYVANVLNTLVGDTDKPIVLDQPFSGNMPQQSFPFFDDAYAIVVDRDPRDLYAIAKFLYHRKGIVYQVPTDTVDNFISYYSNMRKMGKYKEESDHLLFIRLEDLIYHYKETTNRINSFLHIDASMRKRKIFDPELSVRNTQAFRRYPELKEDIMRIENELTDYLFDFTPFKDVNTNGEMFVNQSPLNKTK